MNPVSECEPQELDGWSNTQVRARCTFLKEDSKPGVSRSSLSKTRLADQNRGPSESDPSQDSWPLLMRFAQIGRPKSWTYAAKESSPARRDENATNAGDEFLVLDGLSGQTSSKVERGSRQDPNWLAF